MTTSHPIHLAAPDCRFLPPKGTAEKTVPMDPPSSRVPAVLAREQVARRELAELKLAAAECVLSCAEGKRGAKDRLAELARQISIAELELSYNGRAKDLAAQLDTAAFAAWRAEIQALSPEQIVAGIGVEQCCRRCRPGDCVIGGADIAPSECCHPRKIGPLNLLRHQANEQIRAVYSAAVAKVGRR
jgi:hypothetical protein